MILNFCIAMWSMGSISALAQLDTNPPTTVRTSQSARHAVDDWPRFLGPNVDGVVRTDRQFDWTKPPRLRWSIQVGDGYGMGSVAEGKYFHFDATFDRSTRLSKERIRCFDLKTGKEQWSQSDPLIYRDMLGYEDGPRTSPLIHEGHVFTFGVAGRLSCRRLSNGELIWSIDTNQTFSVVQNFFGVGSSPLILDDQLIVMVGGSPPEDQTLPPMRLDLVRPNGTALVAFDVHTGQQRWACGDDLASYSSPRPIVIDGKQYVLAFVRGGLMLVDPSGGKVQWRYDHRASKLESVNAMVPVVIGSQVLISECYEVGSVLLDINPESRDPIWKDVPARRDRELQQQSFRSHWATPVVIDGYLYGGSGRNPPDSDFRCVEWSSGKVMWKKKGDPRSVRFNQTQVGDVLLVLEERGRVHVVDPNPQSWRSLAQWPFDQATDDRPALRYPCWAAPIVVGNQLLIRGDTRVLCLDLQEQATTRNKPQ